MNNTKKANGKGKQAQAAAEQVEATQQTTEQVEATQQTTEQITSLAPLFVSQSLTRSEAKKNLSIDLKTEVIGFFSWFNVFCKIFVKLSTALQMERNGQVSEAKAIRDGLGTFAQTLYDFVSLNSSQIDMNVLHEVLINRNAALILAANDHLEKKRLDAYNKRVAEGKQAKKDGQLIPFKTFDGKIWTSDRFLRSLLTACNKDYIKAARQAELLAQSKAKAK